jgi:hypothetical protein
MPPRYGVPEDVEAITLTCSDSTFDGEWVRKGKDMDKNVSSIVAGVILAALTSPAWGALLGFAWRAFQWGAGWS